MEKKTPKLLLVFEKDLFFSRIINNMWNVLLFLKRLGSFFTVAMYTTAKEFGNRLLYFYPEVCYVMTATVCIRNAFT